MRLDEELLYVKNEILGLLEDAKTAADITDLRIKYLGKKGQLNLLLKKLLDIPPQERGVVGKVANEVKDVIEQAFADAVTKSSIQSLSDSSLKTDITAPGIRPDQGSLHLITQAITQIHEILAGIGFVRLRYREVDWEWYAFAGLNIPADHPARDDFESFYIDHDPSPDFGKMCLTPHTSNGQLRELERTKPPIRMCNIGKCYRPNYDLSHTPMFHQFEGLVIDSGIAITHLKGTLDYFAREYFGKNRVTRLRPFQFQFTEPSFEVDISCGICSGSGCKFCKEGWLELGGAGMVHPTVLKNGNIDTNKYSGFAFGWGVERVLMMKANLNLPDMRILYQNDLRFLKQF